MPGDVNPASLQRLHDQPVDLFGILQAVHAVMLEPVHEDVVRRGVAGVALRSARKVPDEHNSGHTQMGMGAVQGLRKP